jgi:hypothetical protein
LSVVPRKLVAGLVPESPVSDQSFPVASVPSTKSAGTPFSTFQWRKFEPVFGALPSEVESSVFVK